jgi:hypothetical protein
MVAIAQINDSRPALATLTRLLAKYYDYSLLAELNALMFCCRYEHTMYSK